MTWYIHVSHSFIVSDPTQTHTPCILGHCHWGHMSKSLQWLALSPHGKRALSFTLMAGVGVFPVPWPDIPHGPCEREWFCVLTSLMDSGCTSPSALWQLGEAPNTHPLSLPSDEQLPVIWWACFFFSSCNPFWLLLLCRLRKH